MNPIHERRYCRRFLLDNGFDVNATFDDVERARVYSDRELLPPIRCKGEVPRGKRVDADFCSRYCLENLWSRIHRPPVGAQTDLFGFKVDPADEAEISRLHKAQLQRAIELQAGEWLEKNPEFWAVWIECCEEALRNSESYVSARRIAEEIRASKLTTRGERFKVNNTYVSRFARRAMRQDPRFEVLFKTRQLKRE